MKLLRKANYSNILIYLIMHSGMTMCFFVEPDLGAVGVALALYFITGGLGWSVGIHRGLIHRSFKTFRWVENCLALLDAMSGLGGPVSSSRIHFVRDYCQSNQGISNSDLPRSFGKATFGHPFSVTAGWNRNHKIPLRSGFSNALFFDGWNIVGF